MFLVSDVYQIFDIMSIKFYIVMYIRQYLAKKESSYLRLNGTVCVLSESF